MDDGGTTAVGAWASLPLDLLLVIFRRIGSTAIIRCAGACKPWRHAIISNASILQPRLDRFVPNLHLGVFHGAGDPKHLYLRPTPGPFQSALPWTDPTGRKIRIQSLIPSADGFDREMFTDLLSSRDGFILLKGRQWSGVCLLCNPMTGASKILPDTTIRSCTYVLLTGYDQDATSRSWTGNAGQELEAVRILAVAGTDSIMCTEENRITYQVFSFASQSDGTGAWGPVKRSVELKMAIMVYDPRTVVSGDTVYWLGRQKYRPPETTCAVALDVCTGRAWTTELAEEAKIAGINIFTPTLLGMSCDGCLSLIRSPFPETTGRGQQIQVWVLMADDQWILQRTIDVQVHKLLPDYRPDYFKRKPVLLSAFCPWSGSVIGNFAGQEIRIVLEGSLDTCLELVAAREGFYCDKYNHWTLTAIENESDSDSDSDSDSESEGFYCSNTYEMDCSTYISKMKLF